MIILNCGSCGNNFKKDKKEYNRRIRLNKKEFYCSLSCGAKSPANIQHIKNNKSDYKVWEKAPYSGDEYSKFKRHLGSAKQRNKDFDLTLECLKNLWEEQNGTCPFTGFKLVNKSFSKKDKKSKLSIKTASLDRIDNSKGYVKGNVRFVSVMFNYARNNFEDEDVIEFARALTSAQS